MHKELERHPLLPRETRQTLARAYGRVPREASYFTDGRQDGQAVNGRKPCKDVVPTNQHSPNGGCWALSARSFKGTSNDRVCVFGENQYKTTNQALQSFGSVASTVATHLAIVGRGFCLVPSVVLFKVVCTTHHSTQTAHSAAG